MKKIAYIVPYFGKLPVNFDLWLMSCKTNPTIDWILLTDDKTEYNYPKNVIVKYDTFDNIKERIQSNFDFEIYLDRPWKLCEFRPAYGEIFEEELRGYDFWGHCDIDLIWGNVRKFITDEILSKYEKIGFQGHSTLYKNTKSVNARYKREFSGLLSYKEAFANEKGYCFDEGGISRIYDYMGIPYYKETNFAHLCKYDYGFYLEHLPKDLDYRNKYHILVWDKGSILRYYIDNDTIKTDEFMYIHFFCRPMKYKIETYNENKSYVFYPDTAEILKDDISINYIKSKSKRSAVKYYYKSFMYNRKKITVKRILNNVKWMIKYKNKNK